MEHIIGLPSRKGKEKELTPEILDKTIEAANSLELEDAGVITNLLSKNKAEGEDVKNDDLWDCLFGSARDKPAVGLRSEIVERAITRHLGAEAAEQRRIEDLGEV
jgi:E3 ubiquitin-protein ligase SHPRH